MPKRIDLSATRVREFLTCRRRYWYRYVEGLQPVTRAPALSFGGAVHAGLAKLCAVPGGASREQIWDAIMGSYTAQELEESGLAPKLALEAVSAYDRRVTWQEWDFDRIEHRFEVRLSRGRYLRGVFDGIIRADDVLWVLERKTVKAKPTDRQIHALLWDTQASMYVLAARKLGIPVRGVLYDYVPKPPIARMMATPEEQRTYRRDGQLYAGQRIADESETEYLARVADWYDQTEGFVQHQVTRSEAQLVQLEEELKIITTDIRRAERAGTWYANPGACSVFGCPYQSVCLEDTPEAREVNYTTRDTRTADPVAEAGEAEGEAAV